ncbi:MAG: hypothetical protein ACPG8I_00615, partial [Candidatus Poseidoniaceae archaeon]
TFGWIWLGLVQRRLRSSGAVQGLAKRQRALWCVGIGYVVQFLGAAVALQVNPDVALPTAGVGHPWWTIAALGEYLLVGGLWWGIATMELDVARTGEGSDAEIPSAS